jgi:hypothetical protein
MDIFYVLLLLVAALFFVFASLRWTNPRAAAVPWLPLGLLFVTLYFLFSGLGWDFGKTVG